MSKKICLEDLFSLSLKSSSRLENKRKYLFATCQHLNKFSFSTKIIFVILYSKEKVKKKLWKRKDVEKSNLDVSCSLKTDNNRFANRIILKNFAVRFVIGYKIRIRPISKNDLAYHQYFSILSLMQYTEKKHEKLTPYHFYEPFL